MPMFYDLVFLIIAIIYLPGYLLRRKFQRGFLARLGIFPKGLSFNHPVWIHAVSLGEIIAVKGLYEKLKAAYSDRQFVISTVTATGNQIARQAAEPGDLATYSPLDFSFIVRSALSRVNPALWIIMETEIWPNLISQLYRKHIPIVIINGRISDGSFQGYCLIKFLLKPILNKVTLFCVQTASDAQRLACLGVRPDKIKITGNMKFDFKHDADFPKDYTECRRTLDLGTQDKLLVAGSTHRGEEEIILSVYRVLLKDYSGLRLLIAPRHPERSIELERLIKQKGFNALKISELGAKTNVPVIEKTVFLLDTIGELLQYYALADIVFVGGSLVKKGGHNILEPASLAKPVIFGPQMFNFRDIARMFLEHHAAVSVRNSQELESAIKDLLDNPSQREELGKKAQALIRKNQGATQANLEAIKPFLKS